MWAFLWQCVLVPQRDMELMKGLLLLVLLLHITHASLSVGSDEEQKVKNVATTSATPTTPTTPTTAPSQTSAATSPSPVTRAVATDDFLGPETCVRESYTHRSCAKVFCPPWMRCMEGKCDCKMPYLCPRVGQSACGLDGRKYFSFCQTMAAACRLQKNVFSHFGDKCSADGVFKTSVKSRHRVLELSWPGRRVLVSADGWDLAAANVACQDVTRREEGVARGAVSAAKAIFSSVRAEAADWPTECVSVKCTGSELSLAECKIFRLAQVNPHTKIAMARCHSSIREAGLCEFQCVNGRCVKMEHTCDGKDHCGDGSDEMCCKKCRNKGFWCQSGVCVPQHAVGDGIVDCLGGDDEVAGGAGVVEKAAPGSQQKPEILSDPKKEIKVTRDWLEQLDCGIPNTTYVPPEDKHRTRTKRVVGGAVAERTQIQWQVAVQEDGVISCGGAYLGGCWVLTAAHCVRPKPEAFRVKFSLWQKRSRQSTTDISFVKNIFIHHEYDAVTYRNDIALIQLQNLGGVSECLLPNPAISAVCVPWSPLQFQPGDTCTISGWGRNKVGDMANELLWANVTLIDNCENFYKSRYHAGMMCAGDLDGEVDSCQGDSGGPLVCRDVGGVSYVWGIVSWGEKCGVKGFPGVYTKVAHYFEWIRRITSWNAVTKYNL
ncbi:complement factor I [Denticeps clupeoides]|uniref:trypsin n=1 Tax=Denticeps clupeoides TaxID=299321 RepID=A0AAY3ZW98_9TELE|nr:complement factor I [Denticeps clupeoides]